MFSKNTLFLGWGKKNLKFISQLSAAKRALAETAAGNAAAGAAVLAKAAIGKKGMSGEFKDSDVDEQQHTTDGKSNGDKNSGEKGKKSTSWGGFEATLSNKDLTNPGSILLERAGVKKAGKAFRAMYQ